MNEAQVNELLLQSLEHEIGGVQIYATALKCVLNGDLKAEWEEYHEQTMKHVDVLTRTCMAIGLDPDQKSPGRLIVRKLGQSFVAAMEESLQEGPPEAAELVACECVVFAETKDHADWELISKCGEKLKNDMGEALRQAAEEVEDEEDEHLYHSKGWCRELWIQSLGMKAILPPLEEEKDVKTAIGAAKAEQASDKRR